MQRYKFESNSQLKFTNNERKNCCLCQCKDTNLKAIHNLRWLPPHRLHVVYANAKIQIWKQFTTRARCHCYLAGCLCQCKDTNLKAIHNTVNSHAIVKQLFMPMQRYKFESNSQPDSISNFTSLCCLCQCKDTNLKAIHNFTAASPLVIDVVYANAKIQIWKQFTTSKPLQELEV